MRTPTARLQALPPQRLRPATRRWASSNVGRSAFYHSFITFFALIVSPRRRYRDLQRPSGPGRQNVKNA